MRVRVCVSDRFWMLVKIPVCVMAVVFSKEQSSNTKSNTILLLQWRLQYSYRKEPLSLFLSITQNDVSLFDRTDSERALEQEWLRIAVKPIQLRIKVFAVTLPQNDVKAGE